MALIVHCDGPECSDTTHLDDESLGWITVEGADINVLHFCTLVCTSRFLATSVAFVEVPSLPFD